MRANGTRPYLSNAALRVALVILSIAPLAPCSIIRPVRTLPNWVRGIYIPMAENKTVEIGFEEVLTRRLQEEFLADGRLRVVQKGSADLQLVVSIRSIAKDYTPFGNSGGRRGSSRVGYGESYGSDRISSSEKLMIETDLRLYEPLVDPYDPKVKPFADLGPIITNFTYPSDFRSSSVMLEPDVRTESMGMLARQIVHQTITGFPVDIMGSGPSQQMNAPNPGGTGPTTGPLRPLY